MTANQLNGRSTGALFFTGFGALWLLLGFYFRSRLNAGTAVGVALIASGLVLGAFHLMREARRWPQTTRRAPKPLRGSTRSSGLGSSRWRWSSGRCDCRLTFRE